MAASGSMFRRGLSALLATAAVAVLAGPAAAAHKPYLKPTTFSPKNDYVTVEGGMTEVVAIPDFAIRGTGDWIVVGPDGSETKTAPTNLKGISVVDAPLAGQGTFRITTGERAGRSGKAAKIDGVWRTIRPAPPAGSPPPPPRPAGETPRPGGPIDATDVPAGAETMATESYLIAETYVSRGAPTPGALRSTGKGFELKPITHPSEIYVDDGFAFQLVIDGKPVPGATATIFKDGQLYESDRTISEVTTDAQGKAAATFTRPGVYVMNVRYPAPGGAPAARSWSYSLTFEVTE